MISKLSGSSDSGHVTETVLLWFTLLITVWHLVTSCYTDCARVQPDSPTDSSSSLCLLLSADGPPVCRARVTPSHVASLWELQHFLAYFSDTLHTARGGRPSLSLIQDSKLQCVVQNSIELGWVWTEPIDISGCMTLRRVEPSNSVTSQRRRGAGTMEERKEHINTKKSMTINKPQTFVHILLIMK